MLLPEAPEKREGWRWGTVTQVGPVQVRLDGDTAPLLVVPDVLGSVSVGQRVYCHRNGHRLVVIPDTSGAWAAYTPTLSGITLGNGALTARWSRHGRTVHCTGRITLGSTSSVTGNVAVGLPTSVSTGFNTIYATLGTGMAAKSGAGTVEIVTATIASSASALLRRSNGASISPGVPFAWASGDEITWNLTYEAGS